MYYIHRRRALYTPHTYGAENEKKTDADDITDIETLWDLGDNNNIIIYE